MLGLRDFTAGYHQTPLDPASRELTAFQAADGLYQRIRIAMGLKGAGPYLQTALKVRASSFQSHGNPYPRPCLHHDVLTNTRRVLDSLRNTNVAVNQDWVWRKSNTLVTSFPRRAPHSPHKRLTVLDFSQPTIQRAILQSIGLANYFRDHVTNMTDLV